MEKDNDSLMDLQNPARLKEPDTTEYIIRKIQAENIIQRRDLSSSLQNHNIPAANMFAANITKESVQEANVAAQQQQANILSSDERQERLRILARLQRLSTKPGFPPIQFQSNDSLSELRRKNNIATYAGRAKLAVDMMKRGTVFIAKAAEALSKRYPNAYVDLDGYSSHLYTTIDSYDNMLHEIFDYYGDSFGEVNPILTYIMAVGSNMVMYSMSRKMIRAKEQLSQAFGRRKRRRAPPKSPPPKRYRTHGEPGDMSGPDSGDEAASQMSFSTMNTDMARREAVVEQHPPQSMDTESVASFATTEERPPEKTVEVKHPPLEPIPEETKQVVEETPPISAERAAGLVTEATTPAVQPENNEQKEREESIQKLKIDLSSMTS